MRLPDVPVPEDLPLFALLLAVPDFFAVAFAAVLALGFCSAFIAGLVAVLVAGLAFGFCSAFVAGLVAVLVAGFSAAFATASSLSLAPRSGGGGRLPWLPVSKKALPQAWP